ncbi:hypothetical protein ANTPLA_LOCUS2930 [Anthophora plagiata]
METALLRQQMLRTTIERALINFKKIGRDNQTPVKVQTRINALQTAWQQFQDGHVALASLTSEDLKATTAYFQEDHFALMEEIYLATLEFMDERLPQLTTRDTPSTSASGPSTRPDQHAKSRPSLPPIELPPFTGNYTEWESFRDHFTDLVRENPDLSDHARMHYLLSSVKGPAYDCVKHLTSKAENFATAWAILVSRYENTRRLLDRNLKALFDLPSVTRECATELRALYDKVKSIVASLKNLGRNPATLWDDILVHVVARRFDPATRKAWLLRADGDDDAPSFNDLESFLARRASALEELAPEATKPCSRPATSRVHMATTSTSQSEACPLCSAFHYIQKCTKFTCMTPVERREIVRRHARCFNCLSRRHAVRECPSKHTCRICRKRHHSALHLDSDSDSRLTTGNSHSIAPVETVARTPNDVISHQTSVNSTTRHSMLLTTASVTVGVPGGRRVLVRALIDQGSEVTFISENLAQLLRAKRIRMPTSLIAIGGVSAGAPRHAAQIFVSHRASTNPSFGTVALILKSLTAYTPKPYPDVASFAHLSDLEWADTDPAASTPIDILIGADLYGDIIREGVRKGSSGGPIAQNSIFGWIISGPRESFRGFANTVCQVRAWSTLSTANKRYHSNLFVSR